MYCKGIKNLISELSMSCLWKERELSWCLIDLYNSIIMIEDRKLLKTIMISNVSKQAWTFNPGDWVDFWHCNYDVKKGVWTGNGRGTPSPLTCKKLSTPPVVKKKRSVTAYIIADLDNWTKSYQEHSDFSLIRVYILILNFYTIID